MAPGSYQTRVETVRGCGADLQLCSLLDRLQFDDAQGTASAAGISPEAWPIFGQLWPSARVLAQAMTSLPLEGLRILEVGCGLALASLVLHRRGAQVVPSDCHPLVPEFLQKNLALNALGPLPYREAHWARPNLELGRFNFLIGSDVLYERGMAELLAGFVERHAEEQATVLLVDPNRSQRAAFSKVMEQQGFSLTTTLVSAAPGLDEPYRGRVLRYTRGLPPRGEPSGPGSAEG